LPAPVCNDIDPAMAAKTGFDALMQVVGTEWCLGSTMNENGDIVDVTRFIPETGAVSADQFVDWVFLASYEEAREPKPMWKRAQVVIRAAFVEHMGGETVDAAALRWASPAIYPRRNLAIPNPEAFARNLTEDELLDYGEKYGADSREWIIAQNELARRKGPPWWSHLLAIAIGLACLVYWAYRIFGRLVSNGQ
jgi:hypothetical protein